MSTTILSLGSNLGDREEHISRALSLLSEKAGILISVSKPYYSEAMGYVSKHEFCNVCAKYSTALKPLELLEVCQAVELEMGRVKILRVVFPIESSTSTFFFLTTSP